MYVLDFEACAKIGSTYLMDGNSSVNSIYVE